VLFLFIKLAIRERCTDRIYAVTGELRLSVSGTQIERREMLPAYLV